MTISFPRRSAIVAILLTTLSTPALADPDDGGFYVRAFGGWSSLSDTDLSGAASGRAGFGGGQIFGGAVGYDYGQNPFRTEIEFAYRSAEADGSAGISGDFASTTLALNGYYDFAPVAGGRLIPYVGAGLAYITEIDFDLSGGAAPGEYSDRGGIGYQLMLGATVPLSERWSLNGEIRYFDAGTQELSGSGGLLSADYQTLDILLGASFQF